MALVAAALNAAWHVVRLALSAVYYFLLAALLPVTLLWIIGRLSEQREERNTPRRAAALLHVPSDPHQQQQQPQLVPRRLSFSAALTPNSAAPPPAQSARRVTFSLTPEQQRNEQFKTAVRRRMARPAAATLVRAHLDGKPPLLELYPSPYPAASRDSHSRLPSGRLVPAESAQQIWNSATAMPFRVPRPVRRNAVPVYADDMR